LTMIELICFLQREEEELEGLIYGRENLEEGEFNNKQGRLDEVRRILRKLQRNGTL
jgi:hypothetical protein